MVTTTLAFPATVTRVRNTMHIAVNNDNSLGAWTSGKQAIALISVDAVRYHTERFRLFFVLLLHINTFKMFAIDDGKGFLRLGFYIMFI